MAGKRQHHIWQMLQRGFSWREHSDDHIWVYKNSVAPERTVTRKFGQINRFYDSPGSEADENITKFENATQGFIQEARQMDSGSELDAGTAAALTSHLEMRSLFLRDEMSRLGERVVRFIRDSMASPKQYQAIMSAYLTNHPEMLDAELDKANVEQTMRPLIREIVMKSAPDLIKNSAPEMAKFVGLFYDMITGAMAQTVQNAHNRSLESDFSEVKRTDFHRSLSFSIIRSPESEFILPDTSLAFFTRGGCSPISSKDDRVEAVVIPLSVDVAIIGRRDPSFNRDVKTVQRALASCAYEAFLAPKRSDSLARLSKRISKNAQVLSEAEIRSLVRFESLLKI